MKTSKLQAPSSKKTSITKLQGCRADCLKLASWNFSGGWTLEVGASRSRYGIKILLAAFWLTLLVQPAPLWACAACYGASDSPMAKGMNWGIFSLLGVVVCVLSTFATFFVFLAKKSAAVAAEVPAEPSDKTTEPL